RHIGHLQPPQGVGPIGFDRFSAYFSAPDKFGVTLKPGKLYRSIYPDYVCMEKVAYYFDAEWDGREKVEEYTRPVEEAYTEWWKSWQEQKAFCYYLKGPEYVTIFDNRPLSKSGPSAGRKVLLNEHVSAVYLFCDESHSFSAIRRMLDERFQGQVAETQLQSW